MSGEKTEPPTPKRLRDKREEGQVPNSKEVTSVFLVLGFFGLLLAILPDMLTRLRTLILVPGRHSGDPFETALPTIWSFVWGELVSLTMPFLLVATVGAVAAAVGQFGVLVAPKAVKPSLDKLNPMNWFKKTFGLENLIEFLKGIVKVLLIGASAFIVLWGALDAVVRVPICGIPCLESVTGALLFRLALYVALPAVIIAAADFAFTRWNFTRQNKMSRDEIKREYKEMEGDPLIKGMRKSLHQQLLTEGAVQRASEASVLVVNPTHVAVALLYDQEKVPLPLVTAIGTEKVAERMIAAAERAGVPVMRNVPLARALLADGEVDRHIPSHLIEAVAEVLRALRDLETNREGF
jgi:type III secretion protein U